MTSLQKQFRQIQKLFSDSSRWHSVALGSVMLMAGMMIVLFTRSSTAGPITSASGGLNTTKASVYQGVISIIPDATHAMEIGAITVPPAVMQPGIDIATNSDLYIRPGGKAQASGAKFYLSAAAGNPVSLSIPGELCLGSPAVCNSSWPAGANPTLDQVLGNGNFSSKSASLGSTNAPGGTLLVNNGTAAFGNIGDAIDAYATGAGKIAVRGDNTNASGWAGYFNGNVNISGLTDIHINGYNPPARTAGDLLYVASNSSGGSTLHVTQNAAQYRALTVEGSSWITAWSGPSTGGEFPSNLTPAALNVTSLSPLGPWGIGIYAKGQFGNPDPGHPALVPGSIGVWGTVQQAGLGQFAYGIFGESFGDSGNSFAGQFHGKIGKKRWCGNYPDPYQTNCNASFGAEVTAYSTTSGSADNDTCNESCQNNGMSCVLSWDGAGGTATASNCATLAAGRRCLCM